MTFRRQPLETDNGDFEAKHVILATGVSADLAEKAGLHTKSATEPKIKTVVSELNGEQYIDCDALKSLRV